MLWYEIGEVGDTYKLKEVVEIKVGDIIIKVYLPIKETGDMDLYVNIDKSNKRLKARLKKHKFNSTEYENTFVCQFDSRVDDRVIEKKVAWLKSISKAND